jgi:hypothetical protein
MPAVFLVCSAAFAQDQAEPGPDEHEQLPEGPMTAERLAELILRVDEDAMLEGASWQFKVADIDTIVVFDIAADRMRIIIPITRADELEPEHLLRIMQANFDSALDARYAIGQELLWGTFIHPLGSLTDEEFLVGLGQTVNVVVSFGTSYSSGMLIYGGGDSAEIEQKKLIEELKKSSI